MQLLSIYNQKPESVKKYFADLPDLVNRYDWDVPISYLFSKIKTLKRRTIYAGLVKLHQLERTVTANILDDDYLSRARFVSLFETVFGEKLSNKILTKLSDAEKVRDNVAHGKPLTQAQARQCIADALDFAEAFNNFVFEVGKFRPCADMRGFAGAGKRLSKSTTRWVLRGMGIPSTKRD